MSRKEAISRRKSISLTAQILLIQMMTRWWDRLNGFRTTKSRFHVLLVTKNPRSMGLISPKLTRSSTCYCQGPDQAETVSDNLDRSRVEEYQILQVAQCNVS